MDKKRNRITSLLCAIITLFNTVFGMFGIASTSYAAMTDDFIDSQILLVDKGTCGRYLTYNGEEIQAMYVVYEGDDGKEYPAYCEEPSFQGVGSHDIAYGNYTIRDKVTDERLWRVVTNGYPYKTPSQMGVNGDREAFFATKQAIYRTLDDESIDNYGSLNSEGENMIKAIKNLYEEGLNGEDTYQEPELTVTATTETTTLDSLDGRYKSQTFEVEGNCDFETYTVSLVEKNLPLGTKITSESGVEKTTFENGEKFKVMIPSAENEITAFDVNVTADLKSMPIFHGEANNVRLQSMLITANPYETTSTKVPVRLDKVDVDLTIMKKDSVSGKGLGNATFKVEKIDGTIVGTYTTDNDGRVRVPITEAGYYKITEIEAPEGYLLGEINEQVIYIDFNQENEVVFLNDKKAGLEIVKVDKDSGAPLENARFRVSTASGTVIGEYTTNAKGIINIQDLLPGWYDVEEISAPDNYLKDNEIHKVLIKENEVYTLTLTNKKLKGIQIIKIDSVTKMPLANATFRVKEVGGSLVGEYTTNEMGVIEIQHLEPGFYEIQEVSAPRGYQIDLESKIVEVTENDSVVVEFTNSPKGGLQIKKVDLETGEPLANAKFRIATLTGQTLGEYTTSRTGFINVPELQEGWYIVEETYAPDGYVLDSTPKTVEVRTGSPTIVEFTNQQKAGIQILKVDEATGTPLAGARFRVTTKSGLFIGEYVTDAQGHINIPELNPGWYTVIETEAPEGYILDNVKKDVEVKTYKTEILEFTNKALAGLQIIKRDSVTKQGLAGVTFEVTKINGELIGRYTTNASGLISIPELDEGWYIVSEISTVEGYKIDRQPRNVELKSNVPAIVEFENQPYATLIIQKIDSVTGKAIPNVKFHITKENGEYIGDFTTDSFGQIKLSKTLTPDTYLITEITTPDGYKVDDTVYKVELKWGDNKIEQIRNNPYGSLKILKVDKDTGKALAGVKFKLTNSKTLENTEYITNNKGEVEINNSLEEGIYYLTELETLEGYKLDSTEHEVKIEWGKTTTIRLNNERIKGKIQIIKTSLDNNNISGVLANTRLANAVFEIRDSERNLVDTITTNYDGVATSKELDYGIYFVKETKSPENYVLDTREYKVEITNDNKLVVLELSNKSVDTNVTVEKTGVAEAQCNDVIRYDFNNIKNNSNVALKNFTWHDSLPIQTKLEKVYTGTWSQNLTYSVKYKTNFSSEYKLVRDNLFTTQVYELDFTNIPLQTDERITDIIFEFGTVEAGFTQVEAPFIYVRINNYLNDGTEILNYTEVVGYYNNYRVSGESAWKTKIFNKTKPEKLPKTGC